MSPYEIIKAKCEEKNISIHKLETTLGLSNAYIKNRTTHMTNYPKAKLIADYLDIPIESLMGLSEPLEGRKTADSGSEAIYETISSQYGEGASEAVKILLSLDSEDRAEIRGEMRQMLRLKKYQDKAENMNA